MIKLRGRIPRSQADPFVGRLTRLADQPETERADEILLLEDHQAVPDAGYCAYAGFASSDPAVVLLPPALRYLEAGDIIRVVPRTGDVAVLYRRSSRFNVILSTERCNSNCIMCSQPPKVANDDYLVDTYLQAIPLMSRATPQLGITGGEPTLLGDRFLDLLRACKSYLPETALHVLSNGRLFNYLSLCQRVASIGHHDLMIGIPIYSDIAARHDFVVQAKGAFDQTIRGIINLKRCGVPVELRVVIHRQTADRLPQLARFLARNLPFVDHVALMGLEHMGYVKINFDALWIDPADYQPALLQAVASLAEARLNVSIYNHQLCVLDQSLWPLARQSISDWKNDFLKCCDLCAVRDRCGGFFSSTLLRHSDRIHPLAEPREVAASLS